MRRVAADSPLGFPTVAEPPKQDRAQRLLDRIVTAGRELLADREFDQITVADIAARAGVSVGVFYTRFTSKERLLAHLARGLASELQRSAEKELSADRARTMPMLEIAERYFTLGADAFVRHRAVLKPLSLAVRLDAHRELRALTAAFNTGVHRLLRERLLAHRARIRHADPEAAVDFAILAASAALREIVLYGEPVSRLSRRHRQVALDAARECVSFLVCGDALKS